MKKRIVTLLLALSIVAFPASVFASETMYEVESEPNNTLSDAKSIEIPQDTDHVQIIGTVNQSDTDDWYALEQDDFSITINDLSVKPLTNGEDFTFELSIYDNNKQLRGNCIAEPLHEGDWKYPTLNEIILRKDKKLYVHVKYLSGTARRPYILEFDVKDRY